MPEVMNKIIIEIKCRDFGERPGCLGEPDERFTMRFDEIGEPPLYWCSRCGPEAKAMNEAFTKAIRERGPEFRKIAEDAIKKAEERKNGRQS